MFVELCLCLRGSLFVYVFVCLSAYGVGSEAYVYACVSFYAFLHVYRLYYYQNKTLKSIDYNLHHRSYIITNTPHT